MSALLGVDPGLSGALAILDATTGDLIDVLDMPHTDGHVSGAVVGAFFGAHDIDHAWVEKVHAMPGQGVSSMFKFGMAYGAVLGVIEDRRIPLTRVAPATWKRAAGLTKDKSASRRRATELWPRHAGRFARVRDDGRAEAALIARHGWLELARSAA